MKKIRVDRPETLHPEAALEMLSEMGLLKWNLSDGQHSDVVDILDRVYREGYRWGQQNSSDSGRE